MVKSYVVSGDKYGQFTKCNGKKEFGLVKRAYENAENTVTSINSLSPNIIGIKK